jgi:hypothetical protein
VKSVDLMLDMQNDLVSEEGANANSRRFCTITTSDQVEFK